MKFFRTRRGETYVAQPPAVIDPTPGRDAAAQPRTAIRPARAPAATPPIATARSVADPAQARRIPDAAPHARAPAQASAPAARPAAARVQTAPKHDGSDRSGRRPPQPLTIASHQLVIDLARSGDPVPGLARRFPHVLNQLSAVWGDLPAAADLVDHLLVDRRGGRRGFPADVLAELLTVRRIAVKRMVGQHPKTPKAPGPG
jgi:hypothetical protein